ncbi:MULTISPECIES: type II toxin-antitoxin system RelE family toxin [Clostridium]|uniref:Plasmid stabilization system protein n=2 Tax=Clostridium TaxID=1485 RepID=A0A162NF50_9CLOT|nr:MULTISPECIES: type II toxin-antitoxin system RelE/ParE family toxin [Clostridium]OAA92739.1 Plasmid stabilization system protein [Clostridium coskatii]OBR97728.1 plasmid stabilization system protein [Clostridium coskatii]RMC92297.1 type II toxin-antitoxin system RelE/ParE family toxin [Clostridium autoethanogenum]
MNNSYNISLTKKAEKFIKKQNRDTQKRIIKAIIELPEGDVKKLKGMDEIYRLRVGDFRVLFEKNDKELMIIIVEIGNRGQIYK